MPEQDNLTYYNQQLEFGTQLIDYDRRRRNAQKFLDEGKLTESQYNDYLIKCNDEERIQQTKLENYQQAIEGYSERDKVSYNFYHLFMNGDWDNAAKFYKPDNNPTIIDRQADFGEEIFGGNVADNILYPIDSGEVIDRYNKFFTENNKVQNEKTLKMNKWYYDALEKYNVENDINLTQYGITMDKSSYTINIPHDQKAFIALAKIVDNVSKNSPIKQLFHTVGDGGNLGAAGSALNDMEERYNRMKSKYSNPVIDDVPVHSSLDYIDTFTFVENGQIRTGNGLGSFQEMQAYMDRVNLGIKAGETKFNKQEIQKTFYNQLVGTNAANFPVWTINGNEFKREEFEGGEFEPNTNDDHRDQIIQDIAYAMENQPNAISIKPATDGENYGHVIYIPARENKDGSKQVHPGYRVFVNNFFEKEAIAAYRNDLGVIAKDEIKTMEGYHMPKFKKSVRLQGSNSQGTYQIGSDFNGNYVYLYNNSNGKQFNLNQIFGSPQAAKAALWQVVTAQNKLNTYTNLGVITEKWFDSLMSEYNNASGATTEEILSILGEQSVDETRRNIRTAYKIKNKFKQ